MGVENIITFDAHDPRVQNAIPIRGFDNFYTTLQFIRHFLYTEKDLKIDKDNLIIISPDEGGMSRSVYYANVLGVDMGMFYKRRDYTTIINGKNPIIEHEYLGSTVENKDVFIVDDMISSGESILDVATELKKRKARRVFIAATFGLFNEGFEKFDKAYKDGIIDRIYTTNLTYISNEMLEKPYYECVDISKYIALIIDTLNHDTSVDKILNPTHRIQELLEDFRNGTLK
jgi:ribose-phosphate pyrophosphokinase